MHVFFLFFFKCHIWPVRCNFSLRVYCFDSTTLTSSDSYAGLGVCVYHLSVVSVPVTLHIERCKCAQTLSCLIKYSFFAKMEHPEVRWSVVSSCVHNWHLLLISFFKILSLKCFVPNTWS